VPIFLDHELLNSFEARLREKGVPIVEAWAPGLTDPQIDALLQPLDIDLPDEARVWWRWHNGFLFDSPQRSRQITPFRWLTALETAADEYACMRDPMRDAGDPEGLLAPVGEQPSIYFHCAGAKDAPVPVYSQNDYTDRPRLVLPSIGELVMTWISYVDRGVFATNPDGTWIVRSEKPYPPDVQELGVA
jgi:hypothetical protein